MRSNGIPSSDDFWQSIRREAESARASDPIFGGSLTAAILDHADFASALSWQVGQRLGKTAAERRQFADVAREAFRSSPDLVDAASRDLKAIAVQDPDITGLLPTLLNLCRSACVARVELAVAPDPYRSGAAKPVIGFTPGQYPSICFDRNVGVPRSCNRHHRGFVRRHRRRGDYLSKRHHWAEGHNSRPCTQDRSRRVAELGGNDPWRHQRWRLCQDRRRIGRHQRRARGLYRRRRAGPPDQLSGTTGFRLISDRRSQGGFPANTVAMKLACSGWPDSMLATNASTSN